MRLSLQKKALWCLFPHTGFKASWLREKMSDTLYKIEIRTLNIAPKQIQLQPAKCKSNQCLL